MEYVVYFNNGKSMEIDKATFDEMYLDIRKLHGMNHKSYVFTEYKNGIIMNLLQVSCILPISY